MAKIELIMIFYIHVWKKKKFYFLEDEEFIINFFSNDIYSLIWIIKNKNTLTALLAIILIP